MSENLMTLSPTEFPIIEGLRLDPALHDGLRFSVDQTTFSVIGLKENGIGADRFYKAIQRAWPRWKSYFPIQVPPVTVIETDWGLGGGSLGPFKIAVHLRGDYDDSSTKYLESILGWPPQPTGLAYINAKFASFPDPLQAYVDDQIIHELGHIFFLHGITEVRDDAETWFALGLGLVYDRMIWNEMSIIPSPVFEAFDQIWRERFARNSQIDQRLINPNEENDEEFGLIRLQTYGHAKAGAYLRELRRQLGGVHFDAYVRVYLSRPIGSSISYDDFLSSFSEIDLAAVRGLESSFLVR